MYVFDAPKIKMSLGRAALQVGSPVWLLDPYGEIEAANLLAFWLCGELAAEKAVRPGALIGTSIFDVMAANFSRIPPLLNTEFYNKESAAVKLLATCHESARCASFIAEMKADAQRLQLYERATANPTQEWEYPLKIVAPDKSCLLELWITRYRLEGAGGFLVIASPTPGSALLMEEQYHRLIQYYGNKAYVVPGTLKDRPKQHPAALQDDVCMYYPCVLLDPLWYVVRDSRAHQILPGKSAVGKHFFEVFFSPQFQPWLGPLHETSAPRAFKYFETLTGSFLREEHELHGAYRQALQRIEQLPGLQRIVDISRRWPMQLNLPENREKPFHACSLLLPCALSDQMVLQLRMMLRYVYRGLMHYPDQQHYQLILVPENDETRAALLLHYLSLYLEERHPGKRGQLLWGVALLKTLQEGLKKDEHETRQWDPKMALARITREVEREFAVEPEETILRSGFRKSIEFLNSRGSIRVFGSLLTNMAKVASFEHLGVLIDQEVERLSW